MPTARKTPSGKWRCQAFDYLEIIDGKKKYHHRSFTARTKYEAERMANEFLRNKNMPSSELILTDAIDRYIEIKENVLSPSTIKGYRSLQRNALGHLSAVRIDKITSEDLQECINRYAVGRKAKTCRNALGLLTAVLYTFLPDRTYNVRLPQAVQTDFYTPTDADIETLLAAIKNEELRRAVMLAAFGTLRRSEICGLFYDDIKGDTIHVHRAMVESDHGWVVKDFPKNESSNRTIVYPHFVIDMLGDRPGKLVRMTPKGIDKAFRRAVKHAGLPYFRLHDLRAYSVSIAHALGISDVYNMQRGGWSSPETYRKLYRRVISDINDENTAKLNAHFEKLHTELHFLQKDNPESR